MENPFATNDAIERHLQDVGVTCGSYAWSSPGNSGSGAFGDYPYDGERYMCSSGASYDLASVTKVFTATAMLLLEERREVRLTDPVTRFLPDFRREDVTLKHLLSHTSMLDVFLSEARAKDPTPEGIRRAIGEAGRKPGRYFYQDPNMILAGWVIEAVTGQGLDRFVEEQITAPLGLEATTYHVQGTRLTHTIPTTTAPAGVVHDPTARILGGVAGHAGLFSTTGDLLTFLRMWNGDGTLLRENTLRHALKPVYSSPDGHFGQALGWKMDSPREEVFSFLPGSYMHGGFTGTFILFCPRLRLELAMLTDFIYPGERTPEERNGWWKAVRACILELLPPNYE